MKKSPKRGAISIKRDKTRGNRWKLTVSATASPTGKMTRQWFKTQDEAKAEKARIEAEVVNHGRSGTLLPPDVATDAARAAKMLKPYGINLTAAAKIVVAIEKQRAGSVTFADLYDAYTMNPLKTRRDKTLDNYRNTYNNYEVLFGDRKVSEITAAEIESHLREFTASNALNHYRHLRAWWNFAIKKGWATTNPVLSIELEQPEQREIGLVSNAEVNKVLRAAAKHDEKLVPYFALGFFAGIRPEELQRLNWEDINLDDGWATVTMQSSKVKRRRTVTIGEALKTWLEPRAKKSGPVCEYQGKTFQRHFEDCREHAGLFKRGAGKEGNAKLWPHDVMRHVFASNHLAFYGDLAALQVETGHSDLSMLRDHYLNAVPKKSALSFWQIVAEGSPKPKMVNAA